MYNTVCIVYLSTLFYFFIMTKTSTSRELRRLRLCPRPFETPNQPTRKRYDNLKLRKITEYRVRNKYISKYKTTKTRRSLKFFIEYIV